MVKKQKNGSGVSTLRQAQGSTTAKSFKMRNIIMAILTGGLLTAAWPTWGIAPLAFIGFVPLLLLENRAAQGEKMRLFWLCLPHLERGHDMVDMERHPRSHRRLGAERPLHDHRVHRIPPHEEKSVQQAFR